MKAQLTAPSPKSLILVRHGQSAGNVALEVAHAQDASVIDIEMRDVDVPLSALGERQAKAAGRWLNTARQIDRPTVILTSPYVRARETAERLRAELSDGEKIPIVFDERLREREFGVLDRLTKKGILEQFPDQAELRSRLKKFYYRPPGGESWCDVILRLRSVHDSLSLEYAGERVMIVCHTVVVLCFRYLLEKMSEEQILEIDKNSRLANCSFTAYVYEKSAEGVTVPVLKAFNLVAPMTDEGERVTRKTDVPAEAK